MTDGHMFFELLLLSKMNVVGANVRFDLYIRHMVSNNLIITRTFLTINGHIPCERLQFKRPYIDRF